MGSAALNKPPSPFITFVYCFLLISFLFYIPHGIVAGGVGNGESSVHGSTHGHAPSAVKQGSPPQSIVHGSPLRQAPNAVKQGSPPQNNPNSVKGQALVNCGRGIPYKSCIPNSQNAKTASDLESRCKRNPYIRGCPPANSDPERKSDESMYNWTEGVPPSYNSGGELYPGRH